MKVRVIGVVGAGRMGLTLARLMKPSGLDFVFHDVRPGALEAASREGYGVASSLEELAEKADAVMVAVGHSSVARTVRAVGEALAASPSPRARLVFDIATFKGNVIGEYQGYPRDVMVASAHPLFGPGARDPGRHTVAVIPVPGREEGSRVLSRVFRDAGFNVLVVDAEAHDEAVGYTIGLSYLVATAIAGILRHKWGAIDPLAGTTFRLLRILIGSVARDPEDFISYILSRPQVRRVAGELAEAMLRATRDPDSYAGAVKSLLAGEAEALYRALYDCVEGASQSSEP